MFQFEKRTKRILFGGTTNWNKKVTSSFPVYGPYISNFRLEFQTQSRNPKPELGAKGWYSMLKYVELEVGGNQVEYITGKALEIWDKDPEFYEIGGDINGTAWCIIMKIPFAMLDTKYLFKEIEVKCHVEFEVKPINEPNVLGDVCILLDYEGMYHNGWWHK